MHKKTFALVGLGILVLLFFGVNLFGGAMFRRVRLGPPRWNRFQGTAPRPRRALSSVGRAFDF